MKSLRESQGTVGQMMRERLSEPFLLNAYSIVLMLLGGFRQRVEFDVIVRRPYAFGFCEPRIWRYVGRREDEYTPSSSVSLQVRD